MTPLRRKPEGISYLEGDDFDFGFFFRFRVNLPGFDSSSKHAPFVVRDDLSADKAVLQNFEVPSVIVARPAGKDSDPDFKALCRAIPARFFSRT